MTSLPGTWDADIAKMNDDVAQHGDFVDQSNQDKSDYKSSVLPHFYALLDNHQPEEALLYFLYTIMASTDPQKTDNQLGMSEDQYGITGKSLAVMGDITKVTDDLQNYTNGSVDATPDQISAAVTQLSGLLKQQDVASCFDPDALDTITQQLDLMQSNLTQYFQVDANGHNPALLATIQEMQDGMSETGDPKNATEASQGFTDPESVITSAGQSVNAELNQEISMETEFEKNLQAFMSSLIKSTIDMTNSVIQNYGKT